MSVGFRNYKEFEHLKEGEIIITIEYSTGQ